MQTGSVTVSGNRAVGDAVLVTTGSHTLRSISSLTDPQWLATFGTPSPLLPAGSRVFLQGPAFFIVGTGVAGIVLDAVPVPEPFRCSDASAVSIRNTSGASQLLKYTIEC